MPGSPKSGIFGGTDKSTHVCHEEIAKEVQKEEQNGI